MYESENDEQALLLLLDDVDDNEFGVAAEAATEEDEERTTSIDKLRISLIEAEFKFKSSFVFVDSIFICLIGIFCSRDDSLFKYSISLCVLDIPTAKHLS